MFDVGATSWMLAAGDWLDQQSRVTAAITLGGHHLVVMWLAIIGFVMLAVLAPFTAGFSEANRIQLAVLAVAGIASVVALAGMASVALLSIGVVRLLAILGRAFLR